MAVKRGKVRQFSRRRQLGSDCGRTGRSEVRAKIMHKKTIIALAIAGMVALGTAQGQQIVELKIGNEQRVQIGEGSTAIGYIEVPAGS